MKGSGGMGQLAKGVLVGIVLVLAIIGTMTIFDKDPNSSNGSFGTTNSTSIPAPSINIATQKPSTSVESPTETIEPAVTDSSNTTVAEPQKTEKPVVKNDNFKPVLENEKAPEDKKPVAVKYGMLRLASVDFETKEQLKASYEIFNAKNEKVAETSNTKNTTFRLPEGQYKVVSTLSPIQGARKSAPVKSTQIVNIKADSTTQKLFKMEPPTTIGVLQVSARHAKSNKIMRASFIIQKENGETIATRQNVTNTLFKLKAGSYKVTVKSGNNTDFRTVVIEPGESTKEVFKLQAANLQGKVLVRVFNTTTNKPLPADIVIADANNKTIQELTAVSKTEISLPAGRYKIRVTGPNGQSSKNITVTAGRANNEIFRFDAPAEIAMAPIPEATTVTTETATLPNPNEVQITENVKITAPRNIEPEPVVTAPTNTPVQENQTPQVISTGTLKLFARDSQSEASLKSNFYVQTLSGKNIDKKIYANSAVFDLKPGTYKVTVRSNNKINSVKNIQIIEGETVNETFSLLNKKSETLANQPSRPNSRNNANSPPPPVLGGVKPSKNTVIPNGFLQVAMQPPRKARFIVVAQSGKKIADLASVSNGNFKLDTGAYKVTAILNNQRHSQTIRVRKGKTTRLNFNASSFQPKQAANQIPSKGVLRSRIVNQAGQPIKGNLTVTNMSGRVVARANGVSVGTFNLPVAPYNIIVNYQGLSGSERIKIMAGETTVQTFTIAPQNRTLYKRLR